MRHALAALLAVHGIAHLPGFAVSWRLMTSAAIPYKTTAFGGAIEIGDTGARLLGAGWLLMAVMLLALAIATWANASWWRPAVMIAVTISAILSAAGWPEARLGLLANVAVVGVLFATPHS